MHDIKYTPKESANFTVVVLQADDASCFFDWQVCLQALRVARISNELSFGSKQRLNA
jgi:hypothetical protein